MHVIDAVVAASCAVIVLGACSLRGSDRNRERARSGCLISAALLVIAVLNLLVELADRAGDPAAVALHSATLVMPLVLVGLGLMGIRGVTAEAEAATPLRVVAIGAHPDDLELAAGGTLARWASEGAHVHGLVMSHGSRGGDAERRIHEAVAGAHAMGLVDIDVLDHPDTCLAEHANEMVLAIEDTLRRIEPDIILTHSHHDAHQDHAAVHDAVMRAARRATSILCFESPSVTSEFSPTAFVDISAHLPAKIAAVHRHRDQSGKPYMGADRLRGMAAFRGSQARVEFAEGFEQMRMLVGDHRAPSIVRSEHRAETLEVRTASTRLEPVDGRQP